MKSFLTEELSRIQELMGFSKKSLLTEGLLPTKITQDLSGLWSDANRISKKLIPQRGGKAAHHEIEFLRPSSGGPRKIEVPIAAYKKLEDLISDSSAFRTLDMTKASDRLASDLFWQLADEALTAGGGNRSEIYYNLWREAVLAERTSSNEIDLIKQVIKERTPNAVTGKKPTVSEYLTQQGVNKEFADRVAVKMEDKITAFENGHLKVDNNRTKADGTPNPNYRMAYEYIDPQISDFRQLAAYTETQLQKLLDKAGENLNLINPGFNKAKWIELMTNIKTWAKSFTEAKAGIVRLDGEIQDLYTQCQRLMKNLENPSSAKQQDMIEKLLIEKFNLLYRKQAELGRSMDNLVTKLKSSTNETDKLIAKELEDIKARSTVGNDWKTLKLQLDQLGLGSKFARATGEGVYWGAANDPIIGTVRVLNKVRKRVWNLIKRVKTEEVNNGIKEKLLEYDPNFFIAWFRKLLTGSERGVPTEYAIFGGGVRQVKKVDDGTMVVVRPYTDLEQMGKFWPWWSYFTEVTVNTLKWYVYALIAETVITMWKFKFGIGLNGKQIECIDKISTYMKTLKQDVYEGDQIYEILNAKRGGKSKLYAGCPDCFNTVFPENELPNVVNILDVLLTQGREGRQPYNGGEAYLPPEIREIITRKFTEISNGDFYLFTPAKIDDAMRDWWPWINGRFERWDQTGGEIIKENVQNDQRVDIIGPEEKGFDAWIGSKKGGYQKIAWDPITKVGLAKNTTTQQMNCFTFNQQGNRNTYSPVGCPPNLEELKTPAPSNETPSPQPNQVAKLSKISQALKAKLS